MSATWASISQGIQVEKQPFLRAEIKSHIASPLPAPKPEVGRLPCFCSQQGCFRTGLKRGPVSDRDLQQYRQEEKKNRLENEKNTTTTAAE